MTTRRNPHLDMFPQFPDFNISKRKTALLIIDMQVLDAVWGKGLFANVTDDAQYEYYRTRLQLITQNIEKLLDAFRKKDMLVCHTRMESMRLDGQDRSLQHKILGIHAEPNSEEGQIFEPLKPVKDELVFVKTASCPFNSTNIDYVLRNMKISQLVICGVVTNGCVSTTVRNASDLSYEVIVPEDACGAFSQWHHQSEIEILRDDYAKIRITQDVVEEIMAL